HKDYSEEKARQIDDAINEILSNAFDDARRILTEHRDELVRLTDALVEHETLIDREVRELIGLPSRTSLSDFSDDESDEDDAGPDPSEPSGT
ncbi:MAG: cell division protein FtsH, partial [Spirochaetota bacterium]